jgi:hypothetical protein
MTQPQVVWRGSDFEYLSILESPGTLVRPDMNFAVRGSHGDIGYGRRMEEDQHRIDVVNALMAEYDTLLPRWKCAVLTAEAELQVSLQDDGNDENLPAYPSAPSLGQVNQMTPSDTTAFRMYSESLANHGHNLDPSLIVNAICNHGGSIIFKGSSDWIIDPTLDRHLWGSIGFMEQSGGGCRQRRAIGKQSLQQRGQHRGRNDGRRRWHWHRRRPAHDSPTPPGP